MMHLWFAQQVKGVHFHFALISLKYRLQIAPLEEQQGCWSHPKGSSACTAPRAASEPACNARQNRHSAAALLSLWAALNKKPQEMVAPHSRTCKWLSTEQGRGDLSPGKEETAAVHLHSPTAFPAPLITTAWSSCKVQFRLFLAVLFINN